MQMDYRTKQNKNERLRNRSLSLWRYLPLVRLPPIPDLYENADFSTDTIKASIRDGGVKG
jgi:hypothetical protein